jgi:hypothetical protein
MRSWFLVVALLIGAVACDGDDCAFGKTRCSGESVEICAADGRWEPIANCLDVTASDEPSWRCCAVSGEPDAGAIHACLPASKCVEAAQ